MLWLTLRKLKNKDPLVRIAAIKKLGESKNKRATKPLIEVLVLDYGFGNNYSDKIRSSAVETLSSIDPNWLTSQLGQDAIQQLILQLKSPKASERVSATVGFAHINDKSAVPYLITQLQDEDLSVREKVAEALATLGDPQAIPALIIASVKDLGDYNVKLKRLDDQWGKIDEAKTVVSELLSVFDEEKWQSWVAWFGQDRDGYFARNPNLIRTPKLDIAKVWKIKRAAAFALGEIGDIRAVESLIHALNDEEIPVRDDAAVALGKIGDLRALEPLLDALKKNHYDERSGPSTRWSTYDSDYDVNVKASIAWALGKLGDKRAVDSLLTVFESRERDDRHVFSVMRALAKIGDKRAVAPIASWLKTNQHAWVDNKIIAIQALGEIGGATAQTALKDEMDRVNVKYDALSRRVSKDFERLEAELQSALACAMRDEIS